MSLDLPKLDDRTYTDLVAEALSQIPTYAPDWTNYNPSDPGITLIELFAYLTELLLYRLDQITDENLRSFLQLLNGPEWKPSSQGLVIDVRTTLQRLRQQERAITRQDFESLTRSIDPRVARALCLPRRNPALDFDGEQEGHVGVIVVPNVGNKSDLANIITTVTTGLNKCRLLTTVVHVVGPQYLSIDIQATIVPLPDVAANVLRDKPEDSNMGRIPEELVAFLDPLTGGKDGKGWPFGRDVFVSELYELLDRIPGVDYVTDVTLRRSLANVPHRKILATDRLVGLEVKPYELIQLNRLDITVQPATQPR